MIDADSDGTAHIGRRDPVDRLGIVELIELANDLLGRLAKLGAPGIGDEGCQLRGPGQLAMRSTSFGAAMSTTSSPFIVNSMSSGTLSFCRIMNSDSSSSMWRCMGRRSG